MDKGHYTKIGFRAWLFFLATFAALPMMLFSCFSVLQLVGSQRDLERMQLSRSANLTAEAVNRHLTAWVAMLNALAQSRGARDNDLQDLYQHARRLVPFSPGLLSMALVDAGDSIVFNTSRPFGAPLPHTAQSEAARRVIETGQPSVSDSSVGVISNRPVVMLGVPVWVNNEVRYCLRAVMADSSLAVLLQSVDLPEGWGVALLDASGHVLAQTAFELPPAGVKELLASPGGADEALRRIVIDGEPGIAAVGKVAEWGWHVVVVVPEHILAAPLRRLLLQCLGIGCGCLGLGVIASLWLSRKLAGAMDLVSATSASVKIGEGAILGDRPMIRELDEVRACLWEARDREMQAKTDSVTQLPGRLRFWELAKEVERRCREDAALGLAVIFIDLDGFKQVNDRFGHERGDWVLGQAARVIRATLRDGDAIGRMGGDEFAVCLAAARGQLFDAAASVAERIVTRVRQVGYGIGCSVGVSVCAVCTPDLERALGLADAAMYEAKRLGKNRYILHEDRTREDRDASSPQSSS